jgi:RNA-binding protein
MRASDLNGKAKRHLRALAHDLKPTVQIGNQGVTEGLLGAVDQALTDHELIKVRVSGEDVELDEIGERVAASTRAELVQVIGRMLVLFRRRKNKPVILLPGEKPPKDRQGGNLQRTASKAAKKKRKKKAQARKRGPAPKTDRGEKSEKRAKSAQKEE